MHECIVDNTLVRGLARDLLFHDLLHHLLPEAEGVRAIRERGRNLSCGFPKFTGGLSDITRGWLPRTIEASISVVNAAKAASFSPASKTKKETRVQVANTISSCPHKKKALDEVETGDKHQNTMRHRHEFAAACNFAVL